MRTRRHTFSNDHCNDRKASVDLRFPLCHVLGGEKEGLKVSLSCLATLFQLVYVEGKFEGRTELQPHVLHHHIAAQ